MNKRNDFICIGAIHPDYILRLKAGYFKNRTNPINQQEKLGGVAYNIAKILAFLDQNTKIYSLNCSSVQKKEIRNHGIKFKSLNKEVNLRYYASILNKKGEMILGLAHMDSYEKLISCDNLINFQNKNIILDLNLSSEIIERIIIKNYKKNYICVCGTSAHKVYKIKNLLNKINTIILNKQESLSLTKKKTVKDSMNYLIKKNNELNIVITNGKNTVNAKINKQKYLFYPPPIKLYNENGAGDVLSAIFNYFYCFSFDAKHSLSKSISGGALEASGYKKNKEKYLQKLDKVSKSIKYKIIN
jgi:sugar/nucleoside kinase (ribokinase family)